MSLITVFGSNPFDGQSDPYLSLNSNINYDENKKGEIINSYILEGTLTGCSKNELINAQNKIVNHFDWKKDRSITENININGVISANQERQLIPTSLNFESSNYIGSLGYSLQIDVFTGFDSESINSDSIDLIDKTHTQTKTIDEKGCIKISTNISCAPNPNMTGCGAVQAANQWVNDRLGMVQIGSVTSQSDLTLDSESITIHPVTSEVSYSSSSSDGCSDLNKNINQGQGGKFQTAICSETIDDNPDCVNSTKTEKVKGEIYDPNGDASSLMSYLKSDVISQSDVHDLSANYSNNSLTFSYIKMDPNAPKDPEDYILYDETVTKTIDYDSKSESTSVNGTISLLNPVNKTSSSVNSISDSQIKSKASTSAGKSTASSTSITRDEEQGTISYSISFDNSKEEKPAEDPSLNGIRGISQLSISYTPSLELYDTIPNLNCDDLVVKKNQTGRGSVSISVSAQSGSGYNFQDAGRDLMNQWKNTIIGGAEQVSVEDESETLSNCDSEISLQYSASFIKQSAIDKNTINSMY